MEKKSYYIDKYRYCLESDNEKKDYYCKHEFTEKELHETRKLKKKLARYILKSFGEDELKWFFHSTEGSIFYQEPLGFISLANYDRDEVIITGYGKTVDDAFLAALYDYEASSSINRECNYRQELNKIFSDRFLNGEYSKKDYHGPFFFAELALQDFRRYYEDCLPPEIIDYYNNYLESVGYGMYEYDYNKNCLVIRESMKPYIK